MQRSTSGEWQQSDDGCILLQPCLAGLTSHLVPHAGVLHGMQVAHCN